MIVSREDVVRLWLDRQGLIGPGGERKLTKRRFVQHLERTGGLQLDTINVVDRAHYLTLWSRFGVYDRRRLDRWVYRDHVGYEYWGHEASILPSSHLPIGQRRMRRFPPESWRHSAWWARYQTSTASRRRVLRRLRQEGPLESSDFERQAHESDGEFWGVAAPKEDKRTLQLLWHSGRVAVRERRHFRRVYDLAERVYPEVRPASSVEYEDSWLFVGLGGNGIAAERHMHNYWTAPALRAPERKRVIRRNLRKKRIVEVQVEGLPGPFYALPEHLEMLERLPSPRGTYLLCPFDSLLWQRRRAEELLNFHYRVEIYVPAAKRKYGYYVLPILHDGELVGRLDPKFHRDRGVLDIKALHLEPGFRPNGDFHAGLTETLHSLGEFLGAERLQLPKNAIA